MNYPDNYRIRKFTDSGRGNGLQYGSSSMQGWRIDMEDEHCAISSLTYLKDWSFYAVFDGHGGSSCSKICSQNLINKIEQQLLMKLKVTSSNNQQQQQHQPISLEKSLNLNENEISDAIKVIF
jgi:serine/threonine protein phosphatase PrpC